MFNKISKIVGKNFESVFTQHKLIICVIYGLFIALIHNHHSMKIEVIRFCRMSSMLLVHLSIVDPLQHNTKKSQISVINWANQHRCLFHLTIARMATKSGEFVSTATMLNKILSINNPFETFTSNDQVFCEC